MEFICEIQNSLTQPFCEEIIELYETETEENKKYITTNKKCCELQLTNEKYIETLVCKLQNNLNDYLKEKNIGICFKNKLCDSTYFYINKYVKDEGYYDYHIDYQCYSNNTHRVFSFCWFLNDIDQGGEIVINEKYNIKPETGKFLLFPSFWTHPYSENKSTDKDRYTINGWVIQKGN